MADSEEQFERDETLLHEGKYREWFYQGMDDAGKQYVKLPPRVPIKIPTKSKPTVQNGWFSEQPIWHDEAACKDADPVVFFSESQYPRNDYVSPDAPWRQFCPQCPVRESCLQAARDSKSVGIWGGKLFVDEHWVSPERPAGIHEYDDTNIRLRGRPKKAR
jgi:hypothetical protein